jgi:hypothetical protein
LSWARYYLPGFQTERRNYSREEKEVAIMPVLSVGGMLIKPNTNAQQKKVCYLKNVWCSEIDSKQLKLLMKIKVFDQRFE